MVYVSYERIIDEITDIEEGDSIFVSSDITNLMLLCQMNDETFDGDLFIRTITDKLGSEGTLVFPTYNWGFCKGACFDYHRTRSKVGALTNIALKHPGFRRTKHPIYSFAVWGKHQDALCGFNNISSFGQDSPFAFFYDNYFKNLFIDIGFEDSLTLIHYCQEKARVPYRIFKDFTADYIDENGIKDQRTYSMYVRRLDIKVENGWHTGHTMLDICLRNDAVKYYLINEIWFGVLDIRRGCELVDLDIKNNRSRSIAIYDGQED